MYFTCIRLSIICNCLHKDEVSGQSSLKGITDQTKPNKSLIYNISVLLSQRAAELEKNKVLETATQIGNKLADVESERYGHNTYSVTRLLYYGSPSFQRLRSAISKP